VDAPASDPVATLLAQALALHRAGRLADAAAGYQAVLRLAPAQFDALHLLGVVEHQAGRGEAALAWFERAMAVDARRAPLHANRGAVQRELRRPQQALASLDRALELDPSHAGAHANRAAALLDLERPGEALAAAAQALARVPAHPGALYNRVTALVALGRTREALAACGPARAALPGHVELLFHHGNLLRAAGHAREALACYEQALSHEPRRTELHVQRGHALTDCSDLEAALAAYATALEITPALPWVFGHWLHTRLKLCDWDGLDAAWTRLADAIAAGEPVCEPFVALLAPLAPAQQRRCAETHVQQHWPAPAAPLLAAAASPTRLRIGYFSADFRAHATAQLLAGVIEAHDRTRFEAIAFAFGPDAAGDAMRARLRAGFDRFIDVHERSDAEVAQLARELGIHIAVDLNGHTRGARSGVFAQRAAPLQLAWLGYPGTLGAPFIEDLLADPVVIAPADAAAYSEAVVRLPHCYQPNDDRRAVADRAFTRAELGLPDAAFVFCCFNNPAKITPSVFALWMRLLGALPDAVLWLLDAHPAATRALRRHAERHGIAPQRLVCAPRIGAAEHLARHRLADLALDTWPYGAHTTASDALWAGVPLITWPGEGFAARVGTSLLRACGLPELVADGPAAYEALALALARDPRRLLALREHLRRERRTCPLFDTAGFTRDLEAVYASAWARRCAAPPSASPSP
jgi:predicted O-linked N-acetylglucosamine transferase (SPINDLY family)